jgi:hypothetical protein
MRMARSRDRIPIAPALMAGLDQLAGELGIARLGSAEKEHLPRFQRVSSPLPSAMLSFLRAKLHAASAAMAQVLQSN